MIVEENFTIARAEPRRAARKSISLAKSFSSRVVGDLYRFFPEQASDKTKVKLGCLPSFHGSSACLP